MRRALAVEKNKAQEQAQSIMFENLRAEAATLSVEDARQFLYREARFLDDKEWESWLALYASDAEYWVPSWDDDTNSSPIRRRRSR